MTTARAFAERHQIALYAAAIAVGGALGFWVPAIAAALEHAIVPALALLLFVAFLGVPFERMASAFADLRFLSLVLALNFLVVPLVVGMLSRVVAGEPALLAGVLLVLLTPCVDYVIVFSGLAGGARDRLLAVTPLLMLLQIVLLPLYLWALAGPELVAAVEVGPFVEAFLVLILLPLGLAVVTQVLGRRATAVRRAAGHAEGAMVPLMMITLAVVVGSQVAAVGAALGGLLIVVPVFVLFAAVLAVIGVLIARAARLDRPDRIALVFSGVTRNSLVVLPLALALPASFALAPVVVVTQTLIELVAMVVLVAVFRRPASTPR
ncbi:bile acid:sodium symporter [Microbacterium sp. NPDC089189]|uniref:arsenic resistance protein n=1 Tax=Microbacterium sp. NPDC089189 TaxID=3154972 RepID=UPI003437008D